MLIEMFNGKVIAIDLTHLKNMCDGNRGIIILLFELVFKHKIANNGLTPPFSPVHIGQYTVNIVQYPVNMV